MTGKRAERSRAKIRRDAREDGERSDEKVSSTTGCSATRGEIKGQTLPPLSNRGKMARLENFTFHEIQLQSSHETFNPHIFDASFVPSQKQSILLKETSFHTFKTNHPPSITPAQVRCLLPPIASPFLQSRLFTITRSPRSEARSTRGSRDKEESKEKKGARGSWRSASPRAPLPLEMLQKGTVIIGGIIPFLPCWYSFRESSVRAVTSFRRPSTRGQRRNHVIVGLLRKGSPREPQLLPPCR